MRIYVFGNQDHKQDSAAFEVAEKIKAKKWPQKYDLKFDYVKPNQDIPFVGQKKVIIMDVVEGLESVRLLKGTDLEKIKTESSTTAHDFDLGFQLKYLKKLGKLGEVYIIGIPMMGKLDYDSIHSIFKKLVAQDMQGS